MDQVVLYNIIMNLDIKELYFLSQTNKKIMTMINEKYVLSNLLEKYQSKYLDYEWGYYDFIDLVWEQISKHIDFENNIYFKDEMLTAALIINNRYLNSGDKITTYCDFEYGIKNEWICHAAYFLVHHGFKSIIMQIYDDLEHVYDRKEKDEIYQKWLKLLKMKMISYYFTENDKLLETNLHDYIKPYFEKKYY